MAILKGDIDGINSLGNAIVLLEPKLDSGDECLAKTLS